MTKKLVLFGDSLLGRCNKELIMQLERKLDGKYDVYNCAAGGWDTNDGLKKCFYIATLKADLVIISFGTNDAAPWKKVELQKFETNIKNMLEVFKKGKVIFFLPPPVDEKKQQNEIKRVNETVKKYYDTGKQVCIKKDVEYIDSWLVFLPMLEKGYDYYVNDGVHINEAGYNKLFESIKELV